MYIIYNIYIYLYIILSVIYVIESLLGLRGVTLRKHAKTDTKMGTPQTWKTSIGCIGGDKEKIINTFTKIPSLIQG